MYIYILIIPIVSCTYYASQLNSYPLVRLELLPLPISSSIHSLYTIYDYRVYKHRLQQQQLAIKNASLPHKDIFFKEPAYAKNVDVDVDANDDGPS